MKLCTLCLCFFHVQQSLIGVTWISVRNEEESDGLAVPNQTMCEEEALQLSLGSGCYPEFLGIKGPQNSMDPRMNSTLDYLLL